MKQLVAVLGVLVFCQLSLAAQVFVGVTLLLPALLDAHDRGMARLRRAGLA